MATELGKIKSVVFGHGGYQGCEFGLFIDMGGKGWGITATSPGTTWAPALMNCTASCKWTEADRDRSMAEMCRYVSDLLMKAGVNAVADLIGKPVQCTFAGLGLGKLESWRILDEVL